MTVERERIESIIVELEALIQAGDWVALSQLSESIEAPVIALREAAQAGSCTLEEADDCLEKLQSVFERAKAIAESARTESMAALRGMGLSAKANKTYRDLS